MIEIPVLPERPPRLRHSFSRIDQFSSNCELQYMLDALFGSWEDTPATLRGSHVHSALEQAALQVLDGATWLQAMQAAPDLVPEDKRYLEDEELEGYLARALPVVRLWTPISTEGWFDDCGGLPICGRIDGVYKDEDGEFVLDFKTTGRPDRIKDAWQAKRGMQLAIYCLATGLRRAKYLWFLPAGDAVLTEVEFTEQELARKLYWLEKQIDIIEHRWSNGGWALSRPDNGLCSKSWCKYFGDCIGSVDKTE
jgi:hypothetical protein